MVNRRQAYLVGLFVSLLVLFMLQRFMDGLCFAEHMSGAVWTPQAVWCFQNLGEGRSNYYYDLLQLQAITPVPVPVPPSDVESG